MTEKRDVASIRDEIIVVRLPKKVNSYPRFFVILIVLSIAFLLFFLSPAEAYTLSLSANNPTVSKGETIKFVASVSIEQNELLSLDYLILNLNNSNMSSECKFLSNGSILSGCRGIKIKPLPSSSGYGYSYGYNYGYGYSYGYGYKSGELRYNITLDTTNYTAGSYDTYFSVVSKYSNSTKKGSKVTISPKTSHNTGNSKLIKNACYLRDGLNIYNKNIRGDSGTLNFKNISFIKNQLKISVPNQKARPGSGSLTSQKGKERFSYSFKISKIEDSSDTAIISVSGKYRLGIGKSTLLNATIIVDKETSTAKMVGEGLDFEDINIIFNGRDC